MTTVIPSEYQMVRFPMQPAVSQHNGNVLLVSSLSTSWTFGDSLVIRQAVKH